MYSILKGCKYQPGESLPWGAQGQSQSYKQAITAQAQNYLRDCAVGVWELGPRGQILFAWGFSVPAVR